MQHLHFTGHRLPIARPRRAPQPARAIADAPKASHNTTSTTERIFKSIEDRDALGAQASGAGGATTRADLERADAAWLDLRTRVTHGLPPRFVVPTIEPLPDVPGLDVVVAGGTLGIFLAGALQTAGLRVAVVEQGPLQGRAQEWNVSRAELQQLVKTGVLSENDAEECISVEFNPVRVGFHGGSKDIYVRDVLNLGVSPAKLVELARRQFESRGGLVIERKTLENVIIHPNGVQIRLRSGKKGDPPSEPATAAVAAKLLVDCMGNRSPIVRQARHGQKPDGVCLVVGSCARGFDPDKNTIGDVIYTASPSEPAIGVEDPNSLLHNLQTFWEAFPAGSGPSDRTTYMFTYVDASSERPSLHQMLEAYWVAMPKYQGIATLDDLEVLRVLFGVFPTYRDSPLQPSFDRILACGDSSGIQSPLSFGGFSALTRHVDRLSSSITDAVASEALDKHNLKYINAYNPSLSASWMFQRAMSIPATERRYDRNFINRLLAANFAVMAEAGDHTIRPFLQDVIQAGPLARTLAAQMVSDPLFVPEILMRVGLGPLVDWLLHFFGLVGYTVAFQMAERIGARGLIEKLPDKKQRYVCRRALQRWQYGAGLDYEQP